MNVLILLRRSQAKKYVGIPYGHSWVFWSIVYYVPRVGLPSGHYWVFWFIVHYFPQIVRNHLIFSTEFLSTCLFLFLPACLSACLSVCLSVCVSVCLSVCLSVRLSDQHFSLERFITSLVFSDFFTMIHDWNI